jgi:regulatory protein
MAFRRSRKTYDEAALYEYAVGALGRQMRTVAELKRLLRPRAAAQPDAEAMIARIVARLQEQRYLNDSSYASAYAGYRKENEKFGRLRVVTELKAKGVHSDVIAKSVAAAYAGTDEEKLARAFLRRKRLKKPASQKDAARIFRTLMRAGFTTRTVVGILKHWEVDDEVLAALESEPAEVRSEDVRGEDVRGEDVRSEEDSSE